MSEEEIAFRIKQDCLENGVELDQDGMADFRALVARVGDRWPSQALKVLRERNAALLGKLSSLESQIDSLLLIANKPASLKKDFKAKLGEYEKTIEIAIDYANRHIQNEGEK